MVESKALLVMLVPEEHSLIALVEMEALQEETKVTLVEHSPIVLVGMEVLAVEAMPEEHLPNASVEWIVLLENISALPLVEHQTHLQQLTALVGMEVLVGMLWDHWA